MSSPERFDAAIVGGGPSGLSAALTLARAGRRTVVFDGGPGRNAASPHSHGFLTRDGVPPDELRRLGRAEVEGYGGTIREVEVTDAARTDTGFRLTAAGEVHARVLLLATGVVDELPALPGFAEAWGQSVVHCPYCHGHELRDRPTVLLGHGETTCHKARLLRGWTDDLTVVPRRPEDLSDAQEEALAAEGTRTVRKAVTGLQVQGAAVAAVVFADGEALPCRAVYVQPPQRQRSPLGAQLGLALNDKGCYAADREGRTAVPGLFVIGDATDWPQSIAVAVAEGNWAGMAANYDLVVGPPAG